MPFQELPHTADWSLLVWAADLPALFIEAARGMNAISGVTAAGGLRVARQLSLSAVDAEALLVAFLSELLYFTEQEQMVFEPTQIDLVEIKGKWSLAAKMSGARLKAVNKVIKAVTFHNLCIEQTERGLEVEIVFDV